MSEQDIGEIIEDSIDIANKMHIDVEPLWLFLVSQRPNSALSEAIEDEIEQRAAGKGVTA